MDRFPAIRNAGIQPWLEKLRRHWPDSTAAPVPATEFIVTVEAAFDATNGAETPFGHRWGGDVITLTSRHIEVMRSGQTLALDVMNEYVVFLKTDPEEEKEDG